MKHMRRTLAALLAMVILMTGIPFSFAEETEAVETVVQQIAEPESLGLQAAFNLDGGQSSTMVFNGELISMGAPNDGLRQVSDVIYLCEDPSSSSGD